MNLENEQRKIFAIVTVAVIYLTVSLACDPVAFRLVNVFGYTVGGSGLIFAALYPMLDLLTRLSSRNFTIKLILVFHICDFLFTYLLYGINHLPVPLSFHHLHAYQIVISPLPRLWWGGIIGAVVAGVVEVIIFSFLQKKFTSFFLSSFISTIIILLAHNVPTEAYAFSKVYPHTWETIVATNFIAGVAMLSVYTFIANLSLKFMNRKSNERITAPS